MYISKDSYPFKPQYPQANSPNWSLYISLKNKLREFDKRSKYFLFGDHLINSHNLISWHCVDIVWRKLMLVTMGLRCFVFPNIMSWILRKRTTIHVHISVKKLQALKTTCHELPVYSKTFFKRYSLFKINQSPKRFFLHFLLERIDFF